MLRFGSLLILILAFTACTDVTSIDRVVITVAVSPDRITPGDTAAIVVRFTNASPTPAQVQLFCRHLFEVSNILGEVVAGREPFYCIAVFVPPVTLMPFESIERRFTWNGHRRYRDGVWVNEPVPAGLYRVYGTLDGSRSAPDTVRILP